jgi:hypothetical protein
VALCRGHLRGKDLDRDPSGAGAAGGDDASGRFEAARQVGELARPVSRVAEEYGVCWDTIMAAVVVHGTPLVEDPGRVGDVASLGVDETSFLKANRHHRTRYATGLVDTDAGILIDLVEGRWGSAPMVRHPAL